MNVYNFFKFLEQKKGEKIPIIAKLKNEPDNTTEEEIIAAEKEI